MPSVRRSGRDRKPNSRFTNDGGWDERALRLIQRSSDSPGSSTSESEEAVTTGGRRPTHRVSRVSDEEDWSQDRAPQAARDHSEEDVSDASLESDLSDNPRRWNATFPPSNGKSQSTQHFRGLEANSRPGGSSSDYFSIFGSHVEDLRPVLHARDHWLKGRDITLPSRETLQDTKSSFMAAWKERPAVMTSTALQSLHSNQEVIRVDDQEEFEVPPHSISFGAPKQPASLQALKPFDLGSIHTMKDRTSDIDEGWMLYIGKKISDLAWAPKMDGDQFLAIACKATAKERALVTASSSSRSLAFHRSPAWPSKILLWRFPSEPGTDEQCAKPDMIRRPSLVKSLRLDCGDIRQMAWSSLHSADDIKLLAVLSTDGHVRIISEREAFATAPDSTAPSEPSNSQRPSFVIKASIDIPPPTGCIFTAFAFCGSSDLAIGASDGSMRLYNFLQMTGHSSTPEPYLTHQLHNTYILSLSPAYPSSVPFYIASTSAAGDTVLTDLRSPEQDCVHYLPGSPCLSSKALIYAPYTRSWLTLAHPSDISSPQTSLRCHHLRHFYHSLQVARLPAMTGQGTTIAASSHHPCVLIGNAKGNVFVTNYLRDVLPPAVKQGGGHLQEVCGYGFHPAHETAEGTNVDDLFHGHDVRPGTSIITPATASTPALPISDVDMTGPPRRRRRRDRNKKKDQLKDEEDNQDATDVVFEEEQAATALEWNPNQTHAGWVAMGWGSGILRVRDLGYDAS